MSIVGCGLVPVEANNVQHHCVTVNNSDLSLSVTTNHGSKVSRSTKNDLHYIIDFNYNNNNNSRIYIAQN